MPEGELTLPRRVEAALARNPYVARKKLRFESHEGRVTLQGTVDSFFQKQMAQEIVRRLDGVDRVENQLEVCWS
jgi:osmotically-inducible protein OsmY